MSWPSRSISCAVLLPLLPLLPLRAALCVACSAQAWPLTTTMPDTPAHTCSHLPANLVFRLNNQETDRSGGNMIADEKTMMELYFPPFAAVANKTAGYMCTFGAAAVHPIPNAGRKLRGCFSFFFFFFFSSPSVFLSSQLLFAPREMMRWRPQVATIASTGCMPARTLKPFRPC